MANEDDPRIQRLRAEIESLRSQKDWILENDFQSVSQPSGEPFDLVAHIDRQIASYEFLIDYIS